MRILLTGGLGSIGSAVIRHLINDTDHELLNIDCMTSASTAESVQSVADSERYSFAKVDIADAAALNEQLQTIVVGTYNMLEAAQALLDANPELAELLRFHHISTDEVSGALAVDDAPFNADTPYLQRSPYSAFRPLGECVW